MLSDGRKFTFVALSRGDANDWYADLNNIVVGQQNWQTAGEVALTIGGLLLAAGVAGAAGARSRR